MRNVKYIFKLLLVVFLLKYSFHNLLFGVELFSKYINANVKFSFKEGDSSVVKKDWILDKRKIVWCSEAGIKFLVGIKNKSYFDNKNWILEYKDFDTVFYSENSINPFLNIGVVKKFNWFLLWIESGILFEKYGYFYGETGRIISSAYKYNIGIGLGYLIKCHKNYIIPKINYTYNSLLMWSNKYASSIRYFKDFYYIDKANDLVNADLSYFITVSNKFSIAPSIRLVLFNLNENKLFKYYNYFTTNMSITLFF
jgi:hypothetical protein